MTIKVTLLFFIYFLVFSSYSHDLDFSKEICQRDQRQASHYQPIMRLRANLESQDQSCSGFLISKNCALTAGHCRQNSVIAEFNVPDGNGEEFRAKNSLPEDRYFVDSNKSTFSTRGLGADFAVLKLQKNPHTGLYPGEKYGYLDIDHLTPERGDEIKIVGYGVTYASRERFLSQKFDVGEALYSRYRRGLPFIPTLSSLTYTTGTTGGDSGAPIIFKSTGRAIGIHNNGSCMSNLQRNSGTLLDRQNQLQDAIQKCLEANF